MEMEPVRWDKAQVPEEAWELAEAEWEAAVPVLDLAATVYVLNVVPKYLTRGEFLVIT